MWPAIITAGASVVGNWFSAKGQKEANKKTAESVENQQDFQERMSNTAHQREVADLKAAGLNPLLSANAGASTPSGASMVYQNTDSAWANTGSQMSSAVSAFNETRNVSQHIELTKAEVVKAKVLAKLYGMSYGRFLIYVKETFGAVGPAINALSAGVGGFVGSSARRMARPSLTMAPSAYYKLGRS